MLIPANIEAQRLRISDLGETAMPLSRAIVEIEAARILAPTYVIAYRSQAEWDRLADVRERFGGHLERAHAHIDKAWKQVEALLSRG